MASAPAASGSPRAPEAPATAAAEKTAASEASPMTQTVSSLAEASLMQQQTEKSASLDVSTISNASAWFGNKTWKKVCFVIFSGLLIVPFVIRRAWVLDKAKAQLDDYKNKGLSEKIECLDAVEKILLSSITTKNLVRKAKVDMHEGSGTSAQEALSLIKWTTDLDSADLYLRHALSKEQTGELTMEDRAEIVYHATKLYETSHNQDYKQIADAQSEILRNTTDVLRGRFNTAREGHRKTEGAEGANLKYFEGLGHYAKRDNPDKMSDTLVAMISAADDPHGIRAQLWLGNYFRDIYEGKSSNPHAGEAGQQPSFDTAIKFYNMARIYSNDVRAFLEIGRLNELKATEGNGEKYLQEAREAYQDVIKRFPDPTSQAGNRAYDEAVTGLERVEGLLKAD